VGDFKNFHYEKHRNFEELIGIGEVGIVSQLDSFSQPADLHAETLDDSEKPFLGLVYLNKIFRLERDIPNLLRQSFIFNIYSFFEVSLYLICVHLGEKLAKKPRHDSIFDRKIYDLFSEKKPKYPQYKSFVTSHKGIYKSKEYFKKVIGFNFPAGGQEWEMIRKYQLVRNTLMHSGDQIYQEHEKIEKIINGLDYISINGVNIVIEPEFISTMLKNVDAFMKLLFSQLDINIRNWEEDVYQPYL
jgi:hypothetical protein